MGASHSLTTIRSGLEIPTVKGPTPETVLRSVAQQFSLTEDQILGKSRKKRLVIARDIVAFLLREYGRMSYPAIGAVLGGRDHSTIIHSHNKVLKQVHQSRNFNLEYGILIEQASGVGSRLKEIEQGLKAYKASVVSQAVLGSRTRPSLPVSIPERSRWILDLYQNGLTLQAISERVGVTRERIRQIVGKTIIQLAHNSAISKGIDVDTSVVLLAEKSKHTTARVNAKPKKPIVVKSSPKFRWSRYYPHCQKCKTTAMPHLRMGLCERCGGNITGPRRLAILSRHMNKCDQCGISQPEAFRLFARDLYITKSDRVYCRKCFLAISGKLLGEVGKISLEKVRVRRAAEARWSLRSPQCVRCGGSSSPHYKKGLCFACSGILTTDQRELLIAKNLARCQQCGTSRSEAKKNQARDLHVTLEGGVYCRRCFGRIRFRNLRR